MTVTQNLLKEISIMMSCLTRIRINLAMPIRLCAHSCDRLPWNTRGEDNETTPMLIFDQRLFFRCSLIVGAAIVEL